MARAKVKLAWIANDAARKVTYRKRKRGLMKKVSELNALCGVEVAAIVMSPYEAHPEVWPSVEDVHHFLHKIRTLPQMDQTTKMMNQEGFLRQKIEKMTYQIQRLREENRAMEVEMLMFQCLDGRTVDDLPVEDLDQITKQINVMRELLEQRINFIAGSQVHSLPPPPTEDDIYCSPLPPLPPPQFIIEPLTPVNHFSHCYQYQNPWLTSFLGSF